MGRRCWTQEEIDYLREHWDLPISDICDKLGRHAQVIHQKAAKLGLPNKRKNLWTPEQDQFLREHWQEMSDEEMAEAVGHPASSIHSRRCRLGLIERKGYRGKDWSKEELDYIREVWGEKTIPEIARKLGRSIDAVKVKAFRMGFTGQKWYGEMMSARKVGELLGVDGHTVCDYWIPKCGLKGKPKRLGVSKETTTIIMFEDLLEWLETHQDLWDSRRVERFGLGMEYDWLIEKRKADALKPVRKAQKWTPEEDQRLIDMFRRGGMTNAEMGAALGRPASGVEHRLLRLDVWGTGRYIGDARQKERKAKKERFERTALILQLQRVLLAHRNSMEYGEYWQKDMCMNWDNVQGCKAGCKDCDSCSSFVRIQPQYCVRCGATFFERTENRVCGPCRRARQKSAARKYYHLYGK